MTVVETTPSEYDLLFATTNSCFHAATFAVLNQHKCQEIRYLLFVEKKIRLGLIVGRQGYSWMSPFSAPFGGFSARKKPTLEQVRNAIESLLSFLREQEAETFRMTLPPLFYHPSFLSKVQHFCHQNKFVVTDWDLNYYFKTSRFGADYVSGLMSRNARRNYIAASERNLVFNQHFGEEGLRKAYAIIRQNRDAKGYFLSMTEEEILKTAQLIPTDTFTVSFENQDIASAIIFRTTPDIVQIIYWGDLPEWKENKAMHFMAYKVFEHYAQAGIPLIDAGTAMIDNEPNYGLCAFKESIGCEIQPKLTFVWNRR
jgi:hypothetical protein